MKFLPDPLRVVGSVIEWPPPLLRVVFWGAFLSLLIMFLPAGKESSNMDKSDTQICLLLHEVGESFSKHVTDASVRSDMLFSKPASKMYCRSLNADLPSRHSFHQIERKGYSQEGKLLTVLAADLMFPRQFPNWRQFSGEFSLNSFSAWEEHSDGVCMNRQSWWKLHFVTQYIKSKRGCWILSSFGAKCKIVACSCQCNIYRRDQTWSRK